MVYAHGQVVAVSQENIVDRRIAFQEIFHGRVRIDIKHLADLRLLQIEIDQQRGDNPAGAPD